jgi:hypothetical protein
MFNKTDSLVFTVGDVYWSYRGSCKVLIVHGILKDEQGYTRNFDHLLFVLRDGSMDMINEFMERFCRAFGFNSSEINDFKILTRYQARVHLYSNRRGFDTLTKFDWITDNY